jgi:alpha-galactosidase
VADPTRRDLLLAAAATGLSPSLNAMSTLATRPFLDLRREPDMVRAFGPGVEELKTEKAAPNRWTDPNPGTGNGFEITYEHGRLKLKSQGKVARIQLRWRGDFRQVTHYMGDHWERSYADLEWRGEAPNRVMPWYFLAHGAGRTDGYGVATGAGAMCFWMADSEGVSLWADVRSGGVPVELGDRELEVATILCQEGHAGESPFAAAKRFCAAISPKPRLAQSPVYGTNDWNYAYGNNSADLIARVSAVVAELSPTDNRPFSVIDEGWAMGPYENRFGHGPWVGNPRFGDMAAFAQRLKGLGIRPGLWFRPLTPLPDTPDSWRLQRDHGVLDPTIPEVLEHVASHFRRFTGWGYEIIKHDYTTWDLCGQWGFQMGPSPTKDGWRLHDASQTNAEVLTNLYRTIREAAGSAYLIGCNTVGHLTAGTHELQRIGDDTSGRSWNRNRRMGVNTLAFRAAQHGHFFAADPDIVAITRDVPWELVEQWLRLVSQSGTALFVAADPEFLQPKHRAALKSALALAARPQPVAEPLDWLETECPRRWKLRGEHVEFKWMGESGAWPFSD